MCPEKEIKKVVFLFIIYYIYFYFYSIGSNTVTLSMVLKWLNVILRIINSLATLLSSTRLDPL